MKRISSKHTNSCGIDSLAMRAKIETRKDDYKVKNDPIELIKAIKEYAMAYQDKKYPVATILDSMEAYINIKILYSDRCHGKKATSIWPFAGIDSNDRSNH